MTTHKAIPDLEMAQLEVRAKIDYLKVFSLANGQNYLRDPRYRWTRRAACDGWVLTIHDATRRDIELVVQQLDDPCLLGLEVAVDFAPGKNVLPADREALLHRTFSALAGRFRPEDGLTFGVGYKAAHGSNQVQGPFHERHPDFWEELVLGHRDEGQNAKLYLKLLDNGQELSPGERAVRLEATSDRFGLAAQGVNKLSELLGYGFRGELARVFNIVDRVEVRARANWNLHDVERLAKRAGRAWDRAGIHAFAGPALPADASNRARAAAAYRVSRLEPIERLKLVPHVVAHARIAQALRNLERRLA